MEKGKMEVTFLDMGTKIIINDVFSYIKKKTEDQKDMMLISCKDLTCLEVMCAYQGKIAITGRTLANKKYPDGLVFTCSSCTIVRAEKRLGYSEYLLTCDTHITEE